MPTHYKTAGEALFSVINGSEFEWDSQPRLAKDAYEHDAQRFLASEWGESETLCSECGQRGTHRTDECPFPKTPLLFAEMENTQPQPAHAE